MAGVLTTNRITPGIQRLLRGLRDRAAVHRAMADSGKVITADHFAELTDTQRNPYGKRATFWPRMRRSLRVEADDAAGKLFMGSEVAQRYFGGEIKPTGGRKYLTIPVNPKAYGKRATDAILGKLSFIRQTAGNKTVALLVKKQPKRTFGEVFYMLLKRVTQKPDHSVLPTPQQYENAIAFGIKTYLQRFGQN